DDGSCNDRLCLDDAFKNRDRCVDVKRGIRGHVGHHASDVENAGGSVDGDARRHITDDDLVLRGGLNGDTWRQVLKFDFLASRRVDRNTRGSGRVVHVDFVAAVRGYGYVPRARRIVHQNLVAALGGDGDFLFTVDIIKINLMAADSAYSPHLGANVRVLDGRLILAVPEKTDNVGMLHVFLIERHENFIAHFGHEPGTSATAGHERCDRRPSAVVLPA